MAIIGNIQLGKQGANKGFMQNLRNHFTSCEIVKISVLKSAGREREKVREYSNELLEALGKNYTARVVGFTIIIRKWRKDMR